MKNKISNNHTFLIILEILQLSFILFLCALFTAFCMSNLFGLLDEEMKKSLEDHKISHKIYDFSKTLEVFLQLFLTAIAYYYIEEFLYYIPSISKYIKDTYKEYKTARHVLHIVTIVILIELNSSLQYNIHEVASAIMVNK